MALIFFPPIRIFDWFRVIYIFHFIIKQAFIKSLMLTGIVYAGLSGR